jgi:hypothetical protein
MDANPAALAVNRIDDKVFIDGAEATQIQAYATLGALGLIDIGGMSRLEIAALLYFGIHDQVQVGGIHIGIAENLAFNQGGKGSH